jgi:hypothetical protein
MSRSFRFELKSLPLFRAVCATACLLMVYGVLQPVPTDARERPDAPYALIYGTVWGPDSRPVYGVVVKIRRATEKRERWEVFSDHSGEFAQRVPAGKADYILRADLKDSHLPKKLGLKPGPEVTVHVENDEREDIGLHLVQ